MFAVSVMAEVPLNISLLTRLQYFEERYPNIDKASRSGCRPGEKWASAALASRDQGRVQSRWG